jgi:acyl carrier protein
MSKRPSESGSSTPERTPERARNSAYPIPGIRLSAVEIAAVLENKLTNQQIFEGIKEVLLDALGVDDDEVTMNADLEKDLGAESIDFLDIYFRLEKEFGIKIKRDEVTAEGSFEEGHYIDGDQRTFSAAGVEHIRKVMPHLEQDRVDTFAKNPKVGNSLSMLSIPGLINFIKLKLADKEKQQ